MTCDLAPAFLAAREAASAAQSEPGLEALLGRVLETARAAWPGVELDGRRFVQHLARHLPARNAPEALERLYVADLYLARACVEGVPAALALFESRLLPEVYVAVARLKLPPTAVDELRQQVRQKMLVSTPEVPSKLAAYPGTGPLSGWVQGAALWGARLLLRQQAREVRSDDADLAFLVQPGDDPELAYLKRTYRAEFNDAFTQSLAVLATRQRNVLRLKYLDGMSIDQLGAVYGVHRASAARWVVAAQEALLKETRRRLTERLRLTGSQLDSVLRLISSQLDINLGRLLRSQPE